MAELRFLVEGAARGVALVLEEPLSLWGGSDSATGLITDQRHPQVGARMAGRILVMPSGRGSSSSSSVLAEAIRRGTAPAAILLRDVDPVLAVGAVVAADLYGTVCPIAVAEAETYARIHTGDEVSLDPKEGLTVRPTDG